MVNPDGFEISRSAAPLGDFSTLDYEMKRKNCTISGSTPAAYRTGPCTDNLAGRLRGTDLNRNYPGFWGGHGASASWSSDTYRGDAPGDTPEVDNIKRLISSRQVTNLITNHTYSNLVLRPPSIASTGYAPDEPVYKALGASMTAANDYANWASFQLYDTSGSVEDWSYWQTGGLGFTFEIGPDEFHPAYEDGVVAEYLGLEPAAGAGQGRQPRGLLPDGRGHGRHQAALHPGGHGPGQPRPVGEQVLSGVHLAGHRRGRRDRRPHRLPERPAQLATRAPAAASRGRSTPRPGPSVAGRYGRDPLAPPQPSQALTNPAGTPAEGAYEIATFTIAGMPQYDNAKAEVRIQWPDAAVDWDVYVYDAEGNQVASAASLDDPEVAALIDPVPGTYSVQIENYEGGATSDWTGEVRFASPTPAAYTGVKESWTLTCSTPKGKVVSQQQVVVDRGQQVWVGNACKKVKG